MTNLVFPVLLALLSSLRIAYLPEIELSLIIFMIIYKGLRNDVIILIVAVLTTHHYAIPDHDFRFLGELYPSFYTKELLGIKILDIFAVIFFLVSLLKVNALKNLFSNKLPIILILISFLGVVPNTTSTFDFSILLFLVRNYLILIAFFLATSNYSFEEYARISKIALIGWGAKMLFSICFPHPNPLSREIFDYQGIIYFAGDEFSTLGIYLAIIILISGVDLANKKWGLYFFFLFCLCLIAQRKGAITYFGFVFYLFAKKKGIFFQKVYNYTYFLFDWIILFFILFIDSLDNTLLSLAFFEYTSLAYSAIDSLNNVRINDIYHFFFGLGPFGKYEIINLPDFVDHPMSFGEEVGNKFRYAIWNVPYGRSLVNIGLFGTIILLFTFFKTALKYNSVYFYIYFQVVLMFTFLVITPVGAIALGIALSFILNPQFKGRYLINS
jgi:hypothetical protein